MNPNKPRIKCEFKDACGLFAPECYDKRHANCKEYETRKRLAALERENKELKAKETNAEALRTQVEYWRNRAQERKARAEKAENEADEIAEANERLSANWHKAEEAFGVASRKAREAEAKLAEMEKDLREIMNGLYNSDEGWLAVNPSEIYDELHGLLGKHFPTKKEAGL